MSPRDWLVDFHPRYARILAQVAEPGIRAALVDSNGDLREVCFSLELRDEAGVWQPWVDWDDVNLEHSVDAGMGVRFGWGRLQPGQVKRIDQAGSSSEVRANEQGWWLLAARATDLR